LGLFPKEQEFFLEKFKEFRAFDENKCGLPITYLRSDKCGEYANQPFEEYLV
jgi:hypothetical protein